MRIRGIIGAQICAVIVLLGSTGLFAGLCKNDHVLIVPENLILTDTNNSWLSISLKIRYSIFQNQKDPGLSPAGPSYANFLLPLERNLSYVVEYL